MTITEQTMLRAMDSLDRITETTGIRVKDRARVWAAVEDPQTNWVTARRVKVTPLRTLGQVLADRTGQPDTHVPDAQTILDVLTGVTTPKEAPREAQTSDATDV